MRGSLPLARRRIDRSHPGASFLVRNIRADHPLPGLHVEGVVLAASRERRRLSLEATRRRAQEAAAGIVADLRQRNAVWSEETGEPSAVTEFEYGIAQRQIEEALVQASARVKAVPQAIVPNKILAMRERLATTGECPLCHTRYAGDDAFKAADKLERLYSLLDEWVQASAFAEHVPGWFPDLARTTQDLLDETEE
jgi:hypothetical protein